MVSGDGQSFGGEMFEKAGDGRLAAQCGCERVVGPVAEAHQVYAQGLAWVIAGFVDVVADGFEFGGEPGECIRGAAEVSVALYFQEGYDFGPGWDIGGREVDVAGVAADHLGQQPVGGQEFEGVGVDAAAVCGIGEFQARLWAVHCPIVFLSGWLGWSFQMAARAHTSLSSVAAAAAAASTVVRAVIAAGENWLRILACGGVFNGVRVPARVM